MPLGIKSFVEHFNDGKSTINLMAFAALFACLSFVCLQSCQIFSVVSSQSNKGRFETYRFAQKACPTLDVLTRQLHSKLFYLYSYRDLHSRKAGAYGSTLNSDVDLEEYKIVVLARATAWHGMPGSLKKTVSKIFFTFSFEFLQVEL